MPADKRIPVTEETFNELSGDKPDGMTWDLYIQRLYEAKHGDRMVGGDGNG